jgi:uncharacterized protein
MFATIRRYQGTQPGQTAETISRVKQGLLPILNRQPGFRSYQAVEGENEVAVSVSVYESRAAADGANQAAASWVKDNLADLVGPADVTVGEIALSATAEEQNLAIVQAGYAAFGRGDLPGLLALFDDQVSWVTPGPADLPTAGTRRGHAAVAEFFQALAQLGDIERFEPKQFLAEGQRVVVLGDDTIRIKATGRALESNWVHIFDIRDGKVAAFEERGDVTALVAELRSAQAGV